MDVADCEEKMATPPRRHGVSFHPPLNLNSYLPVAPFPSRLAIAKVVAREDEVHSIQSSSDASPTRKGKKVRIEVDYELLKVNSGTQSSKT